MKGLVFRIGAIVLGVAFAALVLEVGLRLSGIWIGRHSDTMFTLLEHDEVLGWRMRRNLRTEVDLVDVERIPVASNSVGFWDDEWRRERARDACRVVLLGDSFTWGMGVSRDLRFGDRAAALAGWESLNFGVPGYGADQSLLVWREEAASFAPDVVVLTVYQNDYADDLHEVRYGRRKPYFTLGDGDLRLQGVPVSAATFWDDGVFNRIAPPYTELAHQPEERRSRVAHWLVKNSDLVRAFYTVLRGGPAGSGETEPTAEITSVPTPVERLQVDLLLGIIAELRRDLAHAHLLVILAGNPSWPHRTVAVRLRGEGIPVVDATTPHVERIVGRGAAYFPYSGHWTAVAHAAVATMLVEAVAEEGWCSRRS